jgi:hypothetical protein
MWCLIAQQKGTNISQECAAFIFRSEEEAKQAEKTFQER